MFWGVVLIVVFFTAAVAIIVFSRRFQTYVLHKRHPPTPSEDVWLMHQLPPERPGDDPRAEPPGFDDETPPEPPDDR
ncbi:MAG: hypothetical protein ACE5E1_06105 [Phycisphaerae bacterium]